MRKYIHKLSVWLLIIVATLSCQTIHEFPNDNPVDPTTIDVSVKFNLINKEFDPFVSSRTKVILPQNGYDIRYITEVYAIGSTENEFVARKISTVSNESVSDMLIDFTLHARNYVLLFWIDYVEKESTEDLYYDTKESLQAVKIKRPYTGSTPIKDAFVGNVQIDLRPYRGQWNCVIEKEVELIRPFARFEIITNDVEKYIETKSKSMNSPIIISKVEFSYLPRVASQYNVLKLKPEYYSDSESFTSDVEYLSANSCRLAYDYVFMNGDQSNVQVKLDIYDQNNQLLNRVESILIPLKRNALTIYTGEFLTREFNGGGGVGVDDRFEGDEIIYVIQ